MVKEAVSKFDAKEGGKTGSRAYGAYETATIIHERCETSPEPGKREGRSCPRSSEHRFFSLPREAARRSGERAVKREEKKKTEKKEERRRDDNEGTRRPLNKTGSFDR